MTQRDVVEDVSRDINDDVSRDISDDVMAREKDLIGLFMGSENE
jgi:hypothetical protein